MAINPIKFIQSPSASVAKGATQITLTGNINASYVSSGTAIFIGSHQPVEAVSGSGYNPADGTSTITLRQPWPHDDVTDLPLTAFNTIEGLANAINGLKQTIAGASAAEGKYQVTDKALQALTAQLGTTKTNMEAATTAVEQRATTVEQTLSSVQSTLEGLRNTAQSAATTATSKAALATNKATEAVNSATTAASHEAKAQQWAEADGEPTAGSKSAKTWAGESAQSANSAASEAVTAQGHKTTAAQHASTAEQHKTSAAASAVEAKQYRDETQQLAGGDASNALRLGGETADEWEAKIKAVERKARLRRLLNMNH